MNNIQGVCENTGLCFFLIALFTTTLMEARNVSLGLERSDENGKKSDD